MNKKSESILDFVFAFIAILVLTIGIVRIWVWFNANYASRQVDYQKGRLVAGQPRTLFPVQPGQDVSAVTYSKTAGTAATTECPGCQHVPLDLTEEWVFKPDFSLPPEQKIKPANLSGTGVSLQLADTQCRESCKDDPECRAEDYDESEPFDINEDFDPDCYCYVKCYCKYTVSTQAALLAQQVINICGTDCDVKDNDGDGIPDYDSDAYKNCCQACNVSTADCTATQTQPAGGSGAPKCGMACQLRVNAADMRDKADDCDDPWEICWWFTWGKAADELNDAADELDHAAEEMEEEAKELQEEVDHLYDCCEDENLKTMDEKSACISSETLAGESCAEIEADAIDDLNDAIEHFNEIIDYSTNYVLPAMNCILWGGSSCWQFYSWNNLYPCCWVVPEWKHGHWEWVTHCSDWCCKERSEDLSNSYWSKYYLWYVTGTRTCLKPDCNCHVLRGYGEPLCSAQTVMDATNEYINELKSKKDEANKIISRIENQMCCTRPPSTLEDCDCPDDPTTTTDDADYNECVEECRRECVNQAIHGPTYDPDADGNDEGLDDFSEYKDVMEGYDINEFEYRECQP